MGDFCVISFYNTIITPFNGLIITKKGTILFITYFKFKKTNVKNLEKITIIFRKWENDIYSVAIKIFYKNGNIFIDDYAKLFRHLRFRYRNRWMYTISKQQVEKICNKIKDLNFFAITMLDKNNNIIYQKDIWEDFE